MIGALDNGIAAKERLFVAQLGTLGLTEVFERSIKLSPGTLSPNRFIHFMNRDHLHEIGLARILETCRELAMPPALLQLLGHLRERIASLYFGFEAGRDHCVFKIYAELDDPRRLAAAGHAEALGALGLKWDAFDPRRQFVTRYSWIPRLTLDDMRVKLATLLPQPDHARLRRIVDTMLQRAVEGHDARELLYLDVSELTTQRRGFDLNIYDAGFTFEDFRPPITQLCRHYAIPEHTLQDAHPDFWQGTFGHFSCGIGRRGESTVTLYGRFAAHGAPR